PEGAPELAAYADALRHAGKLSEAAAIEARLSRVAGGEGRVVLGHGWRAAEAGRFAEAESLFAAATARDPSLQDAWTAEVRVQLQLGKLQAARATLERA